MLEKKIIHFLFRFYSFFVCVLNKENINIVYNINIGNVEIENIDDDNNNNNKDNSTQKIILLYGIDRSNRIEAKQNGRC